MKMDDFVTNTHLINVIPSQNTVQYVPDPSCKGFVIIFRIDVATMKLPATANKRDFTQNYHWSIGM